MNEHLSFYIDGKWVRPETGEIVRAEVEAYPHPGKTREWKLTVEFEINRELAMPVRAWASRRTVKATGCGRISSSSRSRIS